MEHTLLLLHGDSFKDASGKGVPITNYGVTIKKTDGSLDNGSLYFDGSGTHLEFPQSAAVYADKDFTIDWWEKCEEMSPDQGTRYVSKIVNKGGTFGGLLVGYRNINLFAGTKANNWDLIGAKPMLSITANEWTHWAIVRNKDVLNSYRNGKLFATEPMHGSIYSDNTPHAIGSYGNNDRSDFKGYIQEFRISDVARWTSDFTPPNGLYSKYKKSLIVKTQAPPSLENPVFVKVFTVNPKKRINNRADLPIKYLPNIPISIRDIAFLDFCYPKPNAEIGVYGHFEPRMILNDSPILDRKTPLFIELRSSTSTLKKTTSFYLTWDGEIVSRKDTIDVSSYDFFPLHPQMFRFGERKGGRFTVFSTIELKREFHTSEGLLPPSQDPPYRSQYAMVVYPVINGVPQQQYRKKVDLVVPNPHYG